MVAFPNQGVVPYDAALKAYIDAGDSGAVAAAVQQPADQNFIGWAFDPANINASTIPSAGNLIGARIPVRAATSITNILMAINAVGSGLTAGQNFAALFQNGSLLGVTADQTTPWAAGTGLVTMALAGGPKAVAAGFIDVGFWANGTTRPSFGIGSGGVFSGVFANAGVSGAALRAWIANGGLTTTPPATIGTKTSSILWWMGVS